MVLKYLFIDFFKKNPAPC